VSTETADTTATPAPKPGWRLDTDNGSMAPRSALDVLVDLNDKVTSGHIGEYQPVPLGFTPLDKTIGTGLRPGELLLIGGAQGTGKTTMALQMARNVASGGQANVLYLCFEHDEQYLLNRLVAMESALAHLPHKTGAIKIQDVRKEILGTWMAEGAGGPQLANNPRLRPSLDRIARYGQNLFLLRGSQTASTIENIRKLDLTFGVGPAGTGKTYLAIACAVEALQTDRVRRLVLVRPAVEAGERLGFLPGDMQQKVDPYLRPMFDALYEMMGFEKVARLIERNVIEIAPLAFMRGRTLNDSFVVLDEAQNTTAEQMKMFLTRIGFGSKAVVTGDITQTDLPGHKLSGLRQVIDVLRGVSGVAFTFFTARDVVRHPLVQRIVRAYEAHGEGERPT